MKVYKIFGLFLSLVLLFAGCEDTNENLVVSRGVGIVPGITDVNPAIFDSKDLENSFVQFNVELAEGDVVDKAVIVASYNGDNARVEILEITSFPINVQLFSKETAEKLNIPLSSIENGDVFTFEIFLTSNGKVNTSSSLLNVAVACAFDPDQAVGTYHVISDDWGTEGQVTLTSDPEDPYKIYVKGLATIDGLDEDKGPLVMYINPLDYTVTTERSVLATDYFGYDNGAFEGTGLFGSCDGKYTMVFEITVDQGSFGKYNYVMTRVN